MEIWVATTNLGKLREFKDLLPNAVIKSTKDLSSYSPPDEVGKSFEENARIKARYLRAIKTENWVIGEDSGLEVDGLNKLPGVHSARYAGPKATDVENYSKLIKMISLRCANKRGAQFVSCLVAYSPEGKEYVMQGELPGTISKVPKGTEGFGYDPVFIPNGEEKTLAELGVAFKNKVSHRAQAIRKLTEIL